MASTLSHPPTEQPCLTPDRHHPDELKKKHPHDPFDDQNDPHSHFFKPTTEHKLS